MRTFNLNVFFKCSAFLLLALGTCYAEESPTQIKPSELSQKLKQGIEHIIIDPGFGGRDLGPIGCKKGIYAKDINLEIAKKLKTNIQKKLQLKVTMTRDTDTYITLEERTAIANTKSGDLFISIHTNASSSDSAHGIETYFLNFVTDNNAFRVVGRKNATSDKNIADTHSILSNLMEDSKINKNKKLAKEVQHSICGSLTKKYRGIKDRGTKSAPFYVLIGAQMPAILIDIGFITNENECKRLLTKEYQDDLVQGITNGIQNYIRISE